MTDVFRGLPRILMYSYVCSSGASLPLTYVQLVCTILQAASAHLLAHVEQLQPLSSLKLVLSMCAPVST